jgi:hypothetical protein
MNKLQEPSSLPYFLYWFLLDAGVRVQRYFSSQIIHNYRRQDRRDWERCDENFYIIVSCKGRPFGSLHATEEATTHGAPLPHYKYRIWISFSAFILVHNVLIIL